MAKDRAKDPRRVPSLGSSVKVVKEGSVDSPGYRLGKGEKFDSFGSTDSDRQITSERKKWGTSTKNWENRLGGKTPVVKIDSSK